MKLSLSLTWPTVAVLVAVLATLGWFAYLDPSSVQALGKLLAAFVGGLLLPSPVRASAPAEPAKEEP